MQSFLSRLLLLVLSLGLATTGFAEEEAGLPEDLLARGLAKTWWNNERRMPDIGLTEAQRADMDRHMTEYLRQNFLDKKVQAKSMRELGKALEQASAETAREVGENMAGVVASSLQRQVELMIEVINILSPEQRASLAADYPQLLSRFWARSSVPRIIFPTAQESGGTPADGQDGARDVQ